MEARAPRDPDHSTGAAFIFVDAATGDNAIIVVPGAAGTLSPADAERERDAIEGAAVFVTQMEQPVGAAHAALAIAREAGTITVLNPAPAPAGPLPDGLLASCDWITPNESEAEGLTGIAVGSLDDAERAGRALMEAGAGGVVVTLGERGALLVTGEGAVHMPAHHAGTVAETTGAGDAFNGAFCVALAEGRSPEAAVRFGCAAAGIQVTRPGAAAAMPSRDEVENGVEAALR